MNKSIDALKPVLTLALEALEETRNALAWFYDSYPQDVTEKGNALLPHVETVLTAIRESLADQGVCGEPDTPGTHRTDGPCLAEQPAQQQEPVTDEENEKFSRDVSNFKGADPEATKYALEEFLKNRTAQQQQGEQK